MARPEASAFPRRGLPAPDLPKLAGMRVNDADPRSCPTCGDALNFEILDDERFLVAWSCVNCGLIRTTEPV